MSHELVYKLLQEILPRRTDRLVQREKVTHSYNTTWRRHMEEGKICFSAGKYWYEYHGIFFGPFDSVQEATEDEEFTRDCDVHADKVLFDMVNT